MCKLRMIYQFLFDLLFLNEWLNIWFPTCLSAIDAVWFKTNIMNSQSLMRFTSEPHKNASGSSRVKNSRTLSRLQESSNIIEHFLCCKLVTCKMMLKIVKVEALQVKLCFLRQDEPYFFNQFAYFYTLSKFRRNQHM